MNRISLFLILFLFAAGQAFGEPGRTAPEAVKPPGSAPVSAEDCPPSMKTGHTKLPAQTTRADTQKEAPKKSTPGKGGPPGDRPKAAPLLLKSVGCEADPKGRERVSFTFSRPHRPVLRTIPGEKPRIYFDVPNASIDPGVPAQQDGKGPLVRQVRISHDPASGSIRAAVELVPHRDYIVRPIQYRKENRFLLEIEPKKPRSAVRP